MRRIYVPLGSETLGDLLTLAEQERRTPQDQAAVLIEEGLDLRKKTPQEAEAIRAPGR